MDNREQLEKQIGYYLSNQNLEKDQFFYDKVTSNEEHYVDIESLLKCNKVKKLGYNQINQVAQALKDSKTFQVSKDGTKVRRTDLKYIPEFKGKKKVKLDKEENQHVNPYNNMETVIFSLSLDKDQQVPFRYIQESLMKNFDTYTPYTRFNKNQGNFAIKKQLATQQLVKKLQDQGIKVGQTVLKVTKAEGPQLDQFWQKHGHHYNGIIDNLRKQQDKKIKNEKKAQQRAKKVVAFDFGGQKYDDINKLKSLFKNILCRTPNNQALKQKQTQLVKQLLSYHPKSESKMKDFKHFVVDVNPEYNDTRCYYVVRNDGTREDFSSVKCIQQIENKYSQ